MKDCKTKILHISPHLGGGVGRVLTKYLIKTKKSETFEHRIVCLDTINHNARKLLKAHEIEFEELIHHENLIAHIINSDIIVVHWWNHPLLFDFLVRNEIPPCRTIFWSHVSGQEAPQCFSQSLLDYPDYFVFTTPLSYLTKEVESFHGNPAKFKDIWATGGFSHIQKGETKEHQGFTIGYIGTVDFAKMYPNFIALCAQISIPNVRFIVCGEGGDIETLKRQARELHIADKFVFTGYVENVSEYLESFDLFGYPLNTSHYGTCDQALAEAMVSGVVPVVLNNNMENYMVHHLYSGIVAKDEKEYIDGIIKLYNNKTLRNRLSMNAQEESLKRFSLAKTFNSWNQLFKTILKQPKKLKYWSGHYSGKKVQPHEVFLESIGDYAVFFKQQNTEVLKNMFVNSAVWKAQTKGTPAHYSRFFPEDNYLQQWKILFMSSEEVL